MSGKEKVKQLCNDCEQSFERACKDLQGTEKFLERIRNVLLAMEQREMDFSKLEEIDQEISKLKEEGITLQGHRLNTVFSLIDAFMSMDHLISCTKKYSILSRIFYSGKLYTPQPPADQDMQYFLKVFTKTSTQELQELIDIRQPKYLEKVAPHLKQVIKIKLQDILPKLTIDEAFKKDLFQQLGKQYPNVGKSNYRYLDNPGKTNALQSDFASLIDESTQAIYKAIEESLEHRFGIFKDATHIFQAILMVIGQIEGQLHTHYHFFVSGHMHEVFKQIQARKISKTPTKPNPTSPLPKTPEAVSPSTTSQIPPEVGHFIDELMEKLSVAFKSKREFRRYVSRLYRNQKPIKLEVLCRAYHIKSDVFSQELIDNARSLGFHLEDELEAPKSEENLYPTTESSQLTENTNSLHSMLVATPVQISSIEECIKALTDANYVFASTKNFIKQFDGLFTSNTLKKIARNQIQKNATKLVKKEKKKLPCRTIELKTTGHRVILYENQEKQKIIHGIFTHDQSEIELNKLK